MVDSPFFLVFFYFFGAASREDFPVFVINGTFKAACINFMLWPEMVFSSMSPEKISLYRPSETEFTARFPTKDDHIGEILGRFFTPVRR